MTQKLPITAVIFDFDGTLAATLDGIYTCMCETLHRYGYAEPSLAEVRHTVGLPLEDSLKRLTAHRTNGASLPELVAFYRTLHSEKARSFTTLFPGTLDTLSALRSLRIQMILASNKSGAGLRSLSRQLGIDSYMDLLLGADDALFRKPDARLYAQNIAPHLAEPAASQVLMVGDSEPDILFAKNAGLRACWASYGYGNEDACQALAPEFILPEVARLPALIASLR
jgi:phosphoglycolate phosphatase